MASFGWVGQSQPESSSSSKVCVLSLGATVNHSVSRELSMIVSIEPPVYEEDDGDENLIRKAKDLYKEASTLVEDVNETWRKIVESSKLHAAAPDFNERNKSVWNGLQFRRCERNDLARKDKMLFDLCVLMGDIQNICGNHVALIDDAAVEADRNTPATVAILVQKTRRESIPSISKKLQIGRKEVNIFLREIKATIVELDNVRKYHYRYATIIVYRLLRDDEEYFPEVEGIHQKNPNSPTSVSDHVEFGSRKVSKYISTTTDIVVAFYFAAKAYHDRRRCQINLRIAKIKLRIDLGGCIDLNCEMKRREVGLIEGSRADGWAKAFHEVLVARTISEDEIESIIQVDGKTLSKPFKTSVMSKLANFRESFKCAEEHRMKRSLWDIDEGTKHLPVPIEDLHTVLYTQESYQFRAINNWNPRGAANAKFRLDWGEPKPMNNSNTSTNYTPKLGYEKYYYAKVYTTYTLPDGRVTTANLVVLRNCMINFSKRNSAGDVEIRIRRATFGALIEGMKRDLPQYPMETHTWYVLEHAFVRGYVSIETKADSIPPEVKFDLVTRNEDPKMQFYLKDMDDFDSQGYTACSTALSTDTRTYYDCALILSPYMTLELRTDMDPNDGGFFWDLKFNLRGVRLNDAAQISWSRRLTCVTGI